MQTMLQDEGSVNVLLKEIGLISAPIHFLTEATLARITIIVINLWIGIPFTMLTVTGILMNIPMQMVVARIWTYGSIGVCWQLIANV